MSTRVAEHLVPYIWPEKVQIFKYNDQISTAQIKM